MYRCIMGRPKRFKLCKLFCRLLGELLLALLCDLHEISIQQAWLPGKQRNSQLVAKVRDPANEKGEHGAGRGTAVVQRSTEQ